MKRCRTCRKKLANRLFYKNKRYTDGRDTECILCSKQRQYKFRHSTKTRLKTLRRDRMRSAKRRDMLRAFIQNYLSTHPCVDCGITDSRVLEFDHVKGHKDNSISKMTKQGCAISTIETEIAKCEVRCANCHRIKTIIESGSSRMNW
jgi:hypothetical protein